MASLSLSDTLGSMASNKEEPELHVVGTVKGNPSVGESVELKAADGKGEPIAASDDNMSSKVHKAELDVANAVKINPGAAESVEVNLSDSEGQAIVASSDTFSGKDYKTKMDIVDHKTNVDIVRDIEVEGGKGNGHDIEVKGGKNYGLEVEHGNGKGVQVKDDKRDPRTKERQAKAAGSPYLEVKKLQTVIGPREKNVKLGKNGRIMVEHSNDKGVGVEDDKNDAGKEELDKGASGEKYSSDDEDYEAIRKRNMIKKNAMMARLQLPDPKMKKLPAKVMPREKKVLPTKLLAPIRMSDRIAAKQAKALQVLPEAIDASDIGKSIESGTRKRKLSEDEENPEAPISTAGTVNTLTSQNHAGSRQPPMSITRSVNTRASAKQVELEQIAAGPPDNQVNKDTMTTDDREIIHFPDFPEFTPNLTPAQMISQGVFGGAFWRPMYSEKLGCDVKDDWKELPLEWLEGIDVERYLLQSEPDPSVNKTGVLAGVTIEQQKARGWITSDSFDLRGWFQWYCRFYEGRRCADDQRQIARWLGFLGPLGRYKLVLSQGCVKRGIRRLEDSRELGPVFVQWALQFAWQIHQKDLDEAWVGH